MKHTFSIFNLQFSILLAALLLFSACGQKNNMPKLDDRTDTLSWAVGENIALTLMQLPDNSLDNEIVQQAIRHTLDRKPQPISDSVMQMAMDYFTASQQQNAMRQANIDKKQAEKQQAAYFAQLKKDKPGIKQHPSGFYYEVLKAGNGPTAKYAQVVRFDYRSFLMLTGKPYDQTYGVREPITHVVGKPMFSGLVDGIQLMNAGSIYRFYFPYQLAWGEKGQNDIPGFTPFIYEVELHEIVSHD